MSDVTRSQSGADPDLDDGDEELTPLISSHAEDETDARGEDGAAETFRASIASRDWTVETLVNQMRKGRVDLDPAFQRRNAWLGNRKSKLIESILIGYPIPQIVLAEKRDKPGSYFVLDGKQRLLALRQFYADPADARDEAFEPLRLEQLEILSELNKATIAQLESENPTLHATLDNYTIRTVVLSDWNSERLLLSLFLRLNTGSLTLSPQELRQALIPGDFIRWLDWTSSNLSPLLALLGNRNPDRRMVDAELLLRYLAFSRSPIRYRGNLKQFLDDTCRLYNDTWDAWEPIMDDATADLGEAIDSAIEIFSIGGACRKWSGDRYERALNRAVFDVQTYSLAIPEVREAALANPEGVEFAFQQLCTKSQAFLTSITTTTKTPAAFRTRHRLWREALQEVIAMDYPVPPTLAEAD